MKEHSSICYLRIIEEGSELIWLPTQSAKTFKNEYGLDLFEITSDISHNDRVVSHKGAITEGKTGLKIAGIHTFEETISRIGIDKVYQTIGQQIEKTGLSPRYTRPEETKKDVFGEREKETDGSFLATNVYNERNRYIKVYNEQGIEFFIKKSDMNEFNATLYILVNGYMLGVDQKHCLDDAVRKIEDINAQGGIQKFLTDSLDVELSNPIKWADIGVARILDREQEAAEHNEPIKKMREEARKKDDEERRIRREDEERKSNEEQERLIAKAESAIREREDLSNYSIYSDGGTETSVILFLMRKYNIKVPLRTQGWINSTLSRVGFDENGSVTYYYYKGKNSRNSTVFMEYLKQLVEAVCEQKAA